MTINRFIRRRGLLAASTLALAMAMAATTAPTPASAAPGGQFCITIDGVTHCYPLPQDIDWWELVCPGCPPDLGLHDDEVVNPEWQLVLAEEVAHGVTDLLAARVIGDRGAQESGVAHLERAAELAGPGIAAADDRRGSWTGALETDIADGLHLLQRAAATRDPASASRLHDRALDQFDAVVDVLEGKVIVG